MGEYLKFVFILIDCCCYCYLIPLIAGEAAARCWGKHRGAERRELHAADGSGERGTRGESGSLKGWEYGRIEVLIRLFCT